jgi:hypothetical protein
MDGPLSKLCPATLPSIVTKNRNFLNIGITCIFYWNEQKFDIEGI